VNVEAKYIRKAIHGHLKGYRGYKQVLADGMQKMEDWKCNVSNYVDYLRFCSKQIVGTQFQCLDPGSRDTG